MQHLRDFIYVIPMAAILITDGMTKITSPIKTPRLVKIYSTSIICHQEQRMLDLELMKTPTGNGAPISTRVIYFEKNDATAITTLQQLLAISLISRKRARPMHLPIPDTQTATECTRLILQARDIIVT